MFIVVHFTSYEFYQNSKRFRFNHHLDIYFTNLSVRELLTLILEDEIVFLGS